MTSLYSFYRIEKIQDPSTNCSRCLLRADHGIVKCATKSSLATNDTIMTASPDNTHDSSQSSQLTTETIMEILVRITLAGFGASMVGLAKQKQQQQLLPTSPPSRTRFKQIQNLPMTWAVSGMLFVLVLESCRVASPTTVLWDYAVNKHDKDKSDSSHGTASKNNEYYKTAAVALGDYMLGGSVAGMAGAAAATRSSTMRRPLVWGLGTGLLLGGLAGLLQAGINLSNLYLLQQQQAQQKLQQEEPQREQQMNDQQR